MAFRFRKFSCCCAGADGILRCFRPPVGCRKRRSPFCSAHLSSRSARQPSFGKWIRIAKDRWLRKLSADTVEPTFVVANAKAYKKEHEDQALRQLPNSGCNFELTPIFIDNERRDPKKAWFTIGAVHLPDGFFMNWTGTQQGEGFEYHLLAIAIGLAVFIKGSGAMSVDRD